MKHSRKFDYIHYARIYDDWPHLYSIRSITVKPLKSIYYNRSASPCSVDIIIRSWEDLESFCEYNNIILH